MSIPTQDILTKLTQSEKEQIMSCIRDYNSQITYYRIASPREYFTLSCLEALQKQFGIFEIAKFFEFLPQGKQKDGYITPEGLYTVCSIITFDTLF